jgi:transcriptional regulator with XRE-family HTH domain
MGAYMAIGKNLKKLLEFENISVKELSSASSVANTTIYRIIERDNLTIKPDIDLKISNALNIPIGSLSTAYDLENNLTSLILSAIDNYALYLDAHSVNIPIHSYEKELKDYYDIISKMVDYIYLSSNSLTEHIDGKKDDDLQTKVENFTMLDTWVFETPYEIFIHDMLVNFIKKYPKLYTYIKLGLKTYTVFFEILLDNSNERARDSNLVELVKTYCKIFHVPNVNNSNIVDLPIANISDSQDNNTNKPNKENAWKNADLFKGVGGVPYALNGSMDSIKPEMIKLFSSLNEKGQSKAIEQIEMLAKIPEYQADKTKDSE